MKDKTLKSHIEEFITKNPFIEDGLFNQYINITSLSLILQPYFKKKLNKEVSFNAVKIALFRASKNIQVPRKKAPFSPKDIFIKKNINVFSTNINEKELQKIYKVDRKYISIISGNKGKTYIFDDYYKDIIIKNILSPHQINPQEVRSQLILVGIDAKEGLHQYHGVLYSIAKSCFFYGINIIQTLQTHREFAVVVREDDLQDTIYAISSI